MVLPQRSGRTLTHAPLALGILLGLMGAAWVLAVLEPRHTYRPAAPTTLQSDCDGALGVLAIHYVAEAGDIVGPTYRDFLQQLPRDVRVIVVCPEAAAYADLQRRVGPTACRLEMADVGHAITTWSRDRFLAARSAGSEYITLLCPREEKAADFWPGRAGDAQVGFDLARLLAPSLRARRCGLLFDGGDFAADSRTVFVTPDVALRNLQQTVEDQAELEGQLAQLLNLDVVLLADAPPYHAGMFMMTVGDDTVLVGDPAAARDILRQSSDVLPAQLREQPDFSADMIARFDAVAQQCRQVGYRVVRIPVVPGRDAHTYVTYVNVIMDQRQQQRYVYLPVFDGCDALNGAARQVWESLGFVVRPVDCTRCSQHFGSLRCLVNVVRRTE